MAFSTEHADKQIHEGNFQGNLKVLSVIYIPFQLSSFDGVQAWIPYIKELDPDIRMLVCDTSSTTDGKASHLQRSLSLGKSLLSSELKAKYCGLFIHLMFCFMLYSRTFYLYYGGQHWEKTWQCLRETHNHPTYR